METENKMGTMDTGRLLFQMSLPIMLSMLIQALYNIIDSYFVSQINEAAFTAVSMAFPIQNTFVGLAVGTGVGAKALMSRALGEKNQEKVSKIGENALSLAIFHGFLLFLVAIFLIGPYFRSQTDSAQIISYGIEYTRLVTMAAIGIFFQIAFEGFLQATGRTKLSMYAQIFGAVINIILDPILIFGLFGLPQMGVKGAALATIIGQVLGAILGFVLNKKKNPEVKLKGLDLDFKIIADIYKIGIPSVILITMTSMVIYLLNIILGKFSSTAVAALGAYYKIQSFVFMPVFGLNNGMVPIIAYNYGARKPQRALKTISLAIKTALVVALIGFLIFQIFPHRLLQIFNASDELLEIGIPAIRIISTSFFFVVINFVSNAVFQALGNGVLALATSLLRQVLSLLPAAYFLSLTGNLNLIWLAFPLSEFIGLVFSLYKLKTYAFEKISNHI
ncbi:MAG: MATE family efflux transporter [Bacillota bacterium]|nr:MATE family efflux transporter [Bacillota bacterium]